MNIAEISQAHVLKIKLLQHFETLIKHGIQGDEYNFVFVFGSYNNVTALY